MTCFCKNLFVMGGNQKTLIDVFFFSIYQHDECWFSIESWIFVVPMHQLQFIEALRLENDAERKFKIYHRDTPGG